MLFLKDTAVPRVSDGNISVINVDVDKESEEADEIYIYINFIYHTNKT